MMLKASIALNLALLTVVAILLLRDSSSGGSREERDPSSPKQDSRAMAVVYSHRAPMFGGGPEIHHFSPQAERALRNEGGGTAPVRIWEEVGPQAAAYWRQNLPSKIVMDSGKILVGGKPVPLELLRDYLDSMVSKGAIDYVVIFTSEELSFHDVYDVIDTCRKSQVSTVFISHDRSSR